MAKEQKTGSLRVVVEGLALWVPAKTESGQTIWRVLFPKKTGSNPQHEPRLSVCVEGEPYEELSAPVDLRGRTAVVRGVPLVADAPAEGSKALTATPASASSWLLPMTAQDGSVVKSHHSRVADQVVSEFTMPRGALHAYRPEEQWTSAVHFRGKARAVDFASVVHFPGLTQNAGLQLFGRPDGEPQDQITLPPAKKDVTIILSNRTLPEHHRPGKATRPFEVITETQDLLALTGESHDLPWYEGDALYVEPNEPTLCERYSSSSGKILYSVYRLCPQGYCEECGDD